MWQSEANRDRGEADIIALCRKHGWVAITDDNNGRGGLDDNRCDFSYMSAMLVVAAATGHAGLDADAAWQIHFDVESNRKAPRIYRRELFDTCVSVISRLHTQTGSPTWPHLLRDPRVDLIIDRADRRPLSRRLRK